MGRANADARRSAVKPAWRERWMRFWFEPTEPTNLGISRVLFFGALFFYFLLQDFSRWGGVSEVFWMPTAFFKGLHLPLLSPAQIFFLQTVWKIALLLSCLGWATRLSTLASFMLGIYLLGLPHNFGKTHLFDAMVVFTLGVLALSCCGHAWSVDRLIQAARKEKNEPVRRSGEYTWPIRTIGFVMSLIFFAAGVSKLRHSGVAWFASDNMATILIQQNYHISNADPLTPWGLYLAQNRWLSRGIAFVTVFLELGYPLAMFNGRARWIFVPGIFLMLAGIRIVMGPTFELFMICQLFWIPWGRLGSWILSRLGAQKKFAVFYDGGCGLCKRTMSVIRSLDLLNRVVIYNVVDDWPEIARRFPQLNREACLEDMHAVTTQGKTEAGFDAYRALAKVLPLGWLLLPFLYFPGVRPAGVRVYQAVASGRHQGSCRRDRRR